MLDRYKKCYDFLTKYSDIDVGARIKLDEKIYLVKSFTNLTMQIEEPHRGKRYFLDDFDGIELIKRAPKVSGIQGITYNKWTILSDLESILNLKVGDIFLDKFNTDYCNLVCDKMEDRIAVIYTEYTPLLVNGLSSINIEDSIVREMSYIEYIIGKKDTKNKMNPLDTKIYYLKRLMVGK